MRQRTLGVATLLLVHHENLTYHEQEYSDTCSSVCLPA